MTTTIEIEWGSRSKTVQSRLSNKLAGDSFMLVSPSGNPAKLGWIHPNDVPNWDTARTFDIPLTRTGNQLSINGLLESTSTPNPDNPQLPIKLFHLRLDFDLKVKAGGKTQSALAFRQLFVFGDTGALSALQCATDRIELKSSATGPIILAAAAQNARNRYLGLHPLVTLNANKISINAEFVDLTLLWWSLRNDKLGWYCHPSLNGRQTYLRVLGWTGGGVPMIWFASVPDTAVRTANSSTGDNADLVVYRPPPGINSFSYTADERGLIDNRHDDTTLRILARYLLSPIPASDFVALKAAGTVKEIDLLADQLQPTGGTPPNSPTPADPMDIASGFPFAFRPCAFERSFNRAGENRVMFLPLAAGDTNGTYESATISDLKSSIKSALNTLWNVGALARLDTAVPNLDNRELWMAGHSSGNRSMWLSVRNNKADISRIITFDATPYADNLATGISFITQAVAERKKKKKTLEVFAIVTPNLGQNRKKPAGIAGHLFMGLDDDTDRELRATGASITVLPDFARRESFWMPVPIGTPKTYIQYLLANWSDSLLSASAKKPSNWQFLFFHEMAVFGGDLVQPPSGSPSNTPPGLTTFFEQALGNPTPRPPFP